MRSSVRAPLIEADVGVGVDAHVVLEAVLVEVRDPEIRAGAHTAPYSWGNRACSIGGRKPISPSSPRRFVPVPDDRQPADERRWHEALSLADLGELTAQWLEGAIWSPWYGGSEPDPETGPLVPLLAQMNRAGYVTDFSQPGEVDADWAQRAAVTGYCDADNAERLAALSLRTELIVISQVSWQESNYQLPITRSDDRTFTILPGNFRSRQTSRHGTGYIQSPFWRYRIAGTSPYATPCGDVMMSSGGPSSTLSDATSVSPREG